MRAALICCALLACAAIAARADTATLHSEENVTVEISFHADHSHADPFNDLLLDVVFTDPAGMEWRVPAFWDGGDTWKVRYSSPIAGKHHYRSVCSDVGDRGLHGVTGTIDIAPYKGSNPLYAHGQLRVAPDHRHLQHADGTPFFWLGDTWWMGLSHRLNFPDEFGTLAKDRVQKGFTVVQIVAGLYPDMGAFDPRGANEAGFPWQADYARIRPEYFDAVDARLEYLIDQGLTPCIVGAWGYYMPWMGVDKMKQHWRYLIARYGSMPVVWCAAGEANLPWYLVKGFPYDDREVVHDWTEVIRYIRATDPYHRLLTVHPTAIGWYTSRHATDNDDLLDFDMLQTPHGQREAVSITVKAVRDSYGAAPVMPVINGEAAYEMLNDSLPTRWTRAMFWLCMMNGAAGHTYGANGIWQNNRRGDPHGKSPTGGTYGAIPWDEAMSLPGSAQLGMAKKLIEQYPWQRFSPHPEWAAYADGGGVSLDGAKWIWFPEGSPNVDAPVGKRVFRTTFDLPEGKTVADARLRMTADDAAIAILNGQKIGACDAWDVGVQINDLAGHLRPGKNVLAVEAENVASAVTANPAGLIASIEIRSADGETHMVVTDPSWRCAKQESVGWDTASFDDSAWPQAMAIGEYGCAPWHRIGAGSPLEGPQSAGIPGVVRLIYVLDAKPIVVRHLGSGVTYRVKAFDPVTGDTHPLGEVRADEKGEWTCAPPDGIDHDWVVIMEARDAEYGAGQTAL